VSATAYTNPASPIHPGPGTIRTCPACGTELARRRAFCSDPCAVLSFCRRHGLTTSLPEAERAVAMRAALRAARAAWMRELNARRGQWAR
jgi:hypothetical protein